MRLRVTVDGEAHEVELQPGKVLVDGQAHAARVEGQGPFAVEVDGRRHAVGVQPGTARIDGEEVRFEVEVLPAVEVHAAHGARAGPVKPPMPGRVAEVRVAPGQRVRAGECLVVLEAMKMQNEIAAPAAGTVLEVRVKPGQLVEARDVLVVLGDA